MEYYIPTYSYFKYSYEIYHFQEFSGKDRNNLTESLDSFGIGIDVTELFFSHLSSIFSYIRGCDIQLLRLALTELCEPYKREIHALQLKKKYIFYNKFIFVLNITINKFTKTSILFLVNRTYERKKSAKCSAI